ncbi:hypothetical protein FRC17_008920 [Serendipita sp. 399]|nr:hypothetical protein FRC17_008920 [Serendipita sp. 399]
MPHRPLLAEHIRTHSANPTDAFNEASRFQPEIRPDWGGCQHEKMYDILLEKFSQHPELKQELMGTGDSHLVEDSPTDWFWGIGADRKGENQLGRTLMRLRDYFQSNPLKQPETNGRSDYV